MGETNCSLKGLDEESRKMIVETLSQLKEKLLSEKNILDFDRKEIFPEETMEKLLSDEIGLQLLFIPEEYGGLGGGARDSCEITAEMSRICLGMATAFFAIQLGAEPLIVGGTEDQKKKWLGMIADQGKLVAYAVTEPEAGSNVSSIKTKADPIMDNQGNITGYKINGAKQFISNGGYADFITVLANTPQGPSFFVVEKTREGFQAGKPEEKHGIRCSNTAPLTFSDVIVPVENLVGGVPGQGLKQSNKVFGYTRLMVAAMAYGAGMAAMDIAIDYAKQRVQFGTVLAEKQGYTHKLIVPNIVRLEAAKAYIDETACKLDSSDIDYQVEGSIAKYFSSESANKAADDAIQALGGYGYITEYHVEKIKRDVKITCIYEGTSEIQQNIISTFRWKKTWKTKGEYFRSIANEMVELDKLVAGTGAQYIGTCASITNTIIDLIHKNKLTRKQYVMFALADIATHVEVGAALVRKSVNLARGNDPLFNKLKLVSRIFSNDTTRLVTTKLSKIIFGSGVFDLKTAQGIFDSIPFKELEASYHNIINDMDELSGMIFGL